MIDKINAEKQILGLVKTSKFIEEFLNKTTDQFNEDEFEFSEILTKSEMENPWFTQENLRFSLHQWADLLTENNLRNWLSKYDRSKVAKKVGLILAGNIPLVGFHDVISVIFSNHVPLIKLSSKDKRILPFLLEKWNQFAENSIAFEMVEKLENFDAVIATGSNNTARHLQYYFRNHLSIIRKNRTSIAVLKGDETNEEIQLLAEDIFRYFGLGCRNVTRIFIPKDFKLDRLFENFMNFSDLINHHSYANNYDYHKAIYLLNQDNFWDNNFVMLKEEQSLFSPLSVLNFTRYEDISEVKDFILENENEIQCIVSKPELGFDSVNFGMAQHPSLDTYADQVDTMKFLEVI